MSATYAPQTLTREKLLSTDEEANIARDEVVNMDENEESQHEDGHDAVHNRRL